MFFTVYTCRSKRASYACSPAGAYGGQEGTAFVDITTDPCSVDIADIWVQSGDVLDAIQLRYRFPDGQSETMPIRGGPGGTRRHISVPPGGKVLGISGGIIPSYRPHGIPYGTVITQLRIIVLKSSSDVRMYGPFGTDTESGTFAVYGDIKSLFGYYDLYVNGLGVYYE